MMGTSEEQDACCRRLLFYQLGCALELRGRDTHQRTQEGDASNVLAASVDTALSVDGWRAKLLYAYALTIWTLWLFYALG